MSARYGRNQKRRAREALAAQAQRIDQLEVAHTMDRGLLRHQSNTIDDLRQQIAQAMAIAGDGSVLFEPMKVNGYGAPGDPMNVVSRRPLATLSADDPAPLFDTAVRLETFVAEVEENQLRNELHALLRYDNGAVAYGISRDALARMSERQVEHLVSKNMMPMLARELAKRLVAMWRRR